MRFFSDDARDFLCYQGYGDWVARQDKIIPLSLEEHQLTIEDIIYKGLVSVIIFVRDQSNQRLVAKFSPAEIIAGQITVLRLMRGRTTPLLVDYDQRYDMMLLEYIDQDQSQEISNSELAAALSAWDMPAPAELPSAHQENLEEIESLLDQELSPELRRALLFARQQIELLPEGQRLIHRDLHPDNIIRRGDGTIVILDPHGGRGSVSYDIAYMLTFDEDNFPRFLERARALAAALAIDEVEVYRWAAIRAAIRAAWLSLYWQNEQASSQSLNLFDEITKLIEVER